MSEELSKDLWPNLLHCFPAGGEPEQLYIKGSMPPSDSRFVAVVGARKPSAYGIDVTKEIVHELVRLRAVTVSGLAYGVDAITHEETLKEGGITVAVIGSGIDRASLYPKAHFDLSERIAKRGAVISEYPDGGRAAKWTFPERNRIVAGMSTAVIVTDAAEKSGSLITARYALEYGRDVIAVPGNIFNEHSRGTNGLIKEGAIPLTAIHDLSDILGIPTTASSQETVLLAGLEQKIYDALGQPASPDEIILTTGLARTDVLSVISQLEIRGIIMYAGNNRYRKT